MPVILRKKISKPICMAQSKAIIMEQPYVREEEYFLIPIAVGSIPIKLTSTAEIAMSPKIFFILSLSK